MELLARFGERTRPERLAWLRPVLIAVNVITLAGVTSMLLRGRGIEVVYARWMLHNAPLVPPILWAGRRILLQRPDHACGWLLVATGVVTGLHVGIISIADVGLVRAGYAAASYQVVPAELPLAASIPLWISAWLWIPAIAFLCLLVLLLPDGRLPSPRWRWVPVTVAIGTAAFATGYAIETWPTSRLVLDGNNSLGSVPLTAAAVSIGGALIGVGAAACVASLARRWRTGDPVQRRQVRVVGAAGALTLLVFVGSFPWQQVWVPLSLIATWGFVATYLIAITRYRLHDLDVVISRAVVGTVLAAIVTGLYLLIVVGVGALLGRQSQGTWLPLVAVGVTAVLFDPARLRVQRGVDRLLYGRGGDPSQVLSALAVRLREAVSADEVLDRAVTLLADSTGAGRAEIAVEVEGHTQLAASGEAAHPDAAHPDAAHPDAAHPEVSLTPVALAPVVHRGVRLGEVRLFARAATDLVPHAEDLLGDVAGTLGVVLANVSLTADLERQVVELRESRARLADAHDDARRALERDLHDGAQARLIALRIRLALAGGMAEADASPGLRELLTSMEGEVDEVVRSLRQLARGLHPPVLETDGVVAALRSEVRGLPVQVDIVEERFGRYGPRTELALYFACLEAVQNAIKHAGTDRVQVSLADDGDELRFVVGDTGVGFDAVATGDGSGLRHVGDRLAALGGHLTIDAAPGRGCRLEGRLPITSAAPPEVVVRQPLVADR